MRATRRRSWSDPAAHVDQSRLAPTTSNWQNIATRAFEMQLDDALDATAGPVSRPSMLERRLLLWGVNGSLIFRRKVNASFIGKSKMQPKIHQHLNNS